MAVEITQQERMTLRPILDHIIVEKEPEPRQIGNILLPENVNPYRLGAAEKAQVVAVGPGRINRKGVLIVPDLAGGETVLVKRSMGTAVTTGDGRTLIFVEPDDVLGVLE